MLEKLLLDIRNKKDPEKIKILQKFFKTNVGEYGEGDIFLGLTVPECRQIANNYSNIGIKELSELLKSKFHEERLIALMILINLYTKDKNEDYINFYLNNTKYINNWDLVDLSCYRLLGDYLINFKNSDYEILKDFSKSDNIWERRISIITTIVFIKNNYFEPTLTISETLLLDNHDLIKKAVGWMLREVGKKDQKILEEFLEKNINSISSITLSYAMEKFNSDKKEYYRSLRKCK